MAAPTLTAAQNALVLVQIAEKTIADWNTQLAQAQAQIAALSSYNPAADLALATSNAAGLTAVIAFLVNAMTTQQAVIVAYNTANPGAPLPTG